MEWNFFKRETNSPKKSTVPIKRRPFIYDDEKIEDVIDIYLEVDKMVFKSPQIKKSK